MPATAVRALAASIVAVVAVVAVSACAQTTTGSAARQTSGIDDGSRSPVDVETVLLEQSRMRAITGGGDDLTVIPTMDGKRPVDIDALTDRVPPQCGWLFAETRTFGVGVEEFHKTTYQDPPLGALISQGAAAYRDAETARRALDGLSGEVTACGSSTSGYVGEWATTVDSIRTRTSSECGRDYRVKSVVLVEITFCAYAPSVPDIVMTNILDKIPG